MAEIKMPPPYLQTASSLAEDVVKARTEGKLTNEETVELADLLAGVAAGTTTTQAFQSRFETLKGSEAGRQAVGGVSQQAFPAVSAAFENGLNEAMNRLGADASGEQLKSAAVTELNSLEQALTGTAKSAAISVGDSGGASPNRYLETYSSGGGGGGGGGSDKEKEGRKIQLEIMELNNIFRMLTKKRIPDFAGKTKPGADAMTGIELIGPERAKEMVKAKLE